MLKSVKNITKLIKNITKKLYFNSKSVVKIQKHGIVMMRKGHAFVYAYMYKLCVILHTYI